MSTLSATLTATAGGSCSTVLAPPPPPVFPPPRIRPEPPLPTLPQPTSSGSRPIFGSRTVVPSRPAPTPESVTSPADVGPSQAGLTAIASALGTATAMLAMIFARDGAREGPWMLWAGLVFAGLPIFRYLLDVARRDGPRAWLAVLFGIETVLIKTAHSPRWFTLFDELLHVRTLHDITASGDLGTPNSVLPVSPLFPGLEAVTAAVQQLSGLSWYVAAVLVIVAARVVMVTSVIAIARAVGASRAQAALVAAIYITHPNALFFHAQFAYETLAVPLAAMTIAVLARRSDVSKRPLIDPLVVLLIVAVVATHHVTSYLLAIALIVWTIVALIARSDARHIAAAALATVIAVAFWTLAIAPDTISYLAASTESTIENARALIDGTGDTRAPFQGGVETPVVERIVGATGIVVQCLLVPFGALALWRQRRRHAFIVLLALAALAFPVAISMRFVGDAWEIASRASSLLYIGVAAAIATLLGPWAGRRRIDGRRTIAQLALLLILVSNAIIGTSPTTRLPGPYEPGAGTRSVDQATIEAAVWLRDHRGPGNRLVADRTNTVVMAAYGGQDPITDLDEGITVSPIFLEPELEGYALSQLERAETRFIVVDLRNASGPAEDGHYYESWEHDLYPYEGGVPLDRLTKFTGGVGFDLIYDNGSILIFDTGIGADPVSIAAPFSADGQSLWLVAIRSLFWLPILLIGLGLLVMRAARTRRVQSAEDAGLAVAVSLAAGIVVVLVVGASPIPIRTWSLTIAFISLIAMSSVVARRSAPRPTGRPPRTGPRRDRQSRPTRAGVAATVAVIAILGTALGIVRADSVEHAGPLTELGMQVTDGEIVVSAALRHAPAGPANIVIRVDGETLIDARVSVDADGERFSLAVPDGARSASAEFIDPTTGESLLRTAITLATDLTVDDVFAQMAPR